MDNKPSFREEALSKAWRQPYLYCLLFSQASLAAMHSLPQRYGAADDPLADQSWEYPSQKPQRTSKDELVVLSKPPQIINAPVYQRKAPPPPAKSYSFPNILHITHYGKDYPWYIIAGVGYGSFKDMYEDDGETAFARLTIGKQVASHDRFMIGLEGSIQNGNDMRLDVPQSTLDVIGGLPIQTQMKPIIDLLFNVTTNTSLNTTVTFKGGMAYRNLVAERSTVNNKRQFSFEFQAGAGYNIKPWANIGLYYQRIQGKDHHFHVDATTLTGYIQNIPTQDAFFLQLKMDF